MDMSHFHQFLRASMTDTRIFIPSKTHPVNPKDFFILTLLFEILLQLAHLHSPFPRPTIIPLAFQTTSPASTLF